MRLHHILLSLAVILATGPNMASADEQATGAIKGYECGDNCYLTIQPDGDEEIVGMCAADACGPWNEQAAMPDNMIGKRVQVTIEMGQQTDNDGNLMGEFPAFTDLVFVD